MVAGGAIPIDTNGDDIPDFYNEADKACWTLLFPVLPEVASGIQSAFMRGHTWAV